jgi:AraC-like DNA-binding protein
VTGSAKRAPPRVEAGERLTPNVALFWATPALRVLVVRGDATEDDARAVEAAWNGEIARGQRYASLVDVRRLGRVEEGPLARFLGAAAAARDPLARLVVASAILHASNAGGTLAAGYTRLLGDPFPSRAFTSLDEAMAWLGTPELLGDVAARLDVFASAAEPIDELRRTLRARPDLHLDACARSLGVTPRTLQRMLADRATSLRTERTAARVELAAERLLRSDDKVSAIAAELGFRQPQALVRAFRTRFGVTPAAFRLARRGSSASS